jgi:hypothetical protein
MRKFMMTAATVALTTVGSAIPVGANAMTTAAPAVLGRINTGGVTKTAYVCRRWWSWGRWHRRCYWRPRYGWGWYGWSYYPRHRYWHRHRWHHRHWY